MLLLSSSGYDAAVEVSVGIAPVALCSLHGGSLLGEVRLSTPTREEAAEKKRGTVWVCGCVRKRRISTLPFSNVASATLHGFRLYKKRNNHSQEPQRQGPSLCSQHSSPPSTASSRSDPAEATNTRERAAAEITRCSPFHKISPAA